VSAVVKSSPSSPASPAASGSAQHGPDDVDLAVQLAIGGQATEARRLLDRAAQEGKEAAEPVPTGEPDRAMVGVAFSAAGDALSVMSDKGDEYRFELPSGALHVQAVPRSSSVDDRVLDDPPEITAATQGAEAHALVLRDPLRSWTVPDLPMAARERVIDGFRTKHPVVLESFSGGKAVKLHRRPREPVLFPGSGCPDCRFFDLVLSPGGALLAANYGIANDRVLRVFRLPSGAEVSFDAWYSDEYAFDHGEKRLASLERGQLVVRPIAALASAAKGTVFQGAQGDPGSLTDLAWSADDSLLIAAGASSLVVLDGASGAARCRATASAPIAVPRQGSWVAAMVENVPAIVGTADCKPVRSMKAPIVENPRQMAFSADGARLALLDGGGTVTIFDTASGALRGAIRVGWGGAVVISPDHRIELLGDRDHARGLVGCEVRHKLLPGAVCVDRLTRAGQAAAVLAGGEIRP
jgi:hypothetical protein